MASAAKDENNSFGKKIRQEFNKVKKLFTKNPSDPSSLKRKKFKSFKKVHVKTVEFTDSQVGNLDFDSLKANEISAMPVTEESSGPTSAQSLVHMQKDRPKPVRNHKDRLTMAPQTFMADTQFDKFFHSSEFLLDDSEKSHMKEKVQSNVKGSQEALSPDNDNQPISPKTALLPPKPRPVVPSAEPVQSLVKNVTVQIDAQTKSPMRTRTVSEMSSPVKQDSDSRFKPPSLITASMEPWSSKNLPNANKTRPISELLVSSSPPKTEQLFTAISEESVIKRVLLKKSDTIYVASTSRSGLAESRPRSISEVGSIQEKEIAAVISTKAISLEEKTGSNQNVSVQNEEQTKAVLREKRPVLAANSSEQRKSVLEMRKLFESSKSSLIHSSSDSLGGDKPICRIK